MLLGGNAVDSAIATMYCNSVVNSQSMGLGGGFIMTVHLANGTSVALIARETAPAAATRDMFHGNPDLTHYGPLAAGVPGFVAGTWELKQRLGSKAVSWQRLLQPAIDLCFQGITVNSHQARYSHIEKRYKLVVKRTLGSLVDTLGRWRRSSPGRSYQLMPQMNVERRMLEQEAAWVAADPGLAAVFLDPGTGQPWAVSQN